MVKKDLVEKRKKKEKKKKKKGGVYDKHVKAYAITRDAIDIFYFFFFLLQISQKMWPMRFMPD